MENQPQPHKACKKNSQPVRSTTGTSSQLPPEPVVQKATTVAQTTVTATIAAAKEAVPSTTAQPLEDASETERIMREFWAKFGKEEKPSAVLAKMAEALRVQEDASQLTPLNIPPRPSTLDEPQRLTESPPQATEPLSATTHEENAPSTSIPVPNQPHAEKTEYTVEEIMEEAERAGKAGEVVERVQEDVVGEEDTADDGIDGDLGVGVVDRGLESVAGETLAIGIDELEGETPGTVGSLEGETPILSNEKGETHVENVVEGETPAGEIAVGLAPIDYEEVIPHDIVEEVAVGDDVGNEEEEPLKEIVVLGDESVEEATPVDDRTARRNTRRSRIIEDLAETPRARKLMFRASQGEDQTEGGDSQAEEEPGADEDLSRAEEKRLEAERKRKEKVEAKALTKKHKAVSSTLVIQEPAPEKIRMPFAKAWEGPGAESEAEEDEDSEQPDETAYEKIEVWVTKRLLEAMAEFDDPRRAETYKERSASGMMVKSGKCYDSEAMKEIESEEEFLSYIGAIRFEWLLNHSTTVVLVALEKEFFSTFKFKSTMDPDADSVSFRLFNEEYVLSIREWSL